MYYIYIVKRILYYDKFQYFFLKLFRFISICNSATDNTCKITNQCLNIDQLNMEKNTKLGSEYCRNYNNKSVLDTE